MIQSKAPGLSKGPAAFMLLQGGGEANPEKDLVLRQHGILHVVLHACF